MNDRISFRDRLEEVVGEGIKLYFQPPEGLKLTFPCIVYEMANVEIKKADNSPYIGHKRYTVTVIDKNPDSDIYMNILNGFEHAKYSNTFKSDNFYHYVISIYW